MLYLEFSLFFLIISSKLISTYADIFDFAKTKARKQPDKRIP